MARQSGNEEREQKGILNGTHVETRPLGKLRNAPKDNTRKLSLIGRIDFFGSE
jgi:hypothetical protein